MYYNYDHLPYTYLIGGSKYNKFYYGRRTAKNCHPRDLWVSYFTSSKYVKRFREEFGEPDIIQIRRTFDNIVKCLKGEERFLFKMCVVQNENFLNMSVSVSTHDTTGVAPAIDMEGNKIGLVSLNDPRGGIEIFGSNKGNKLSEEAKRRISDSKIGKPSGTKGLTKETDERVHKISESAKEGHSDPERNKNHRIAAKESGKRQKELGTFAGENNPMYGTHRAGEDNPMYGKKHSEETKRKMSENRKGKKHKKGSKPMSEEQKEKLRKPKSPETKQKLKDAGVIRKQRAEEAKNLRKVLETLKD